MEGWRRARLRAGLRIWHQRTREHTPETHLAAPLVAHRAALALRTWHSAAQRGTYHREVVVELGEAQRTRQLRGAWIMWLEASAEAQHLLASTQRGLEHWADQHIRAAFLVRPTHAAEYFTIVLSTRNFIRRHGEDTCGRGSKCVSEARS